MKRIIYALPLLALGLTSCSLFRAAPTPAPTEEMSAPTDTVVPPTETAVPTPMPTATAELVDYGPTDFPPNINPLTGLPVSDPAMLDRRPLAVKIQLFPREGRPPFGLSLADVVFDFYQNNGMTRLHAIFYGNDYEQVGPIRSARLFDGELIEMYKSIFAFGSADKRILRKLLNADYANRLIFEGALNCPPMCRIDPDGGNYLVANTKEMGPYIETRGEKDERQNLDGMKFQHATPAGGTPAVQIFTRFSISAYVRWDYDQASGKYLRFQDTQEDGGQGEAYAPLVDRVTNAQISADNVVILVLPHKYEYKSGNSEIIDIEMSGEGMAYAFRDGYAYEVRWVRSANDALFTLQFADGTPYPYKPGVTYYVIMGTSSTLDKQEGGIWRFVWSMP
ncbi:MAG: DUF3048 domain-containing protein [Anaerolineales bacterium]